MAATELPVLNAVLWGSADCFNLERVMASGLGTIVHGDVMLMPKADMMGARLVSAIL